MMDYANLEHLRLRLEELQVQLNVKDINSPNADPADPNRSPLSPRGQTFGWLDEQHPDDAAELAALLNEAVPRLGLKSYRRDTPTRIMFGLRRTHSQVMDTLIRARLKAARPMAIGAGQVDWSKLVAIVSSENVTFHDKSNMSNATGLLKSTRSPTTGANTPVNIPLPPTARPVTPAAERLEVNSGGKVLFCLFESDYTESPAPTPPVSRNVTPERGGAFVPSAGLSTQNPTAAVDGGASIAAQTLVSLSAPAAGGPTATGSNTFDAREGCLVVKFVPSRLICQSEQFANELARHVGVCAPDSRIFRQKGASEGEWKSAMAAASSIASHFPELYEEMGRNDCMLVMEYIPGQGLFHSPQVFDPAVAAKSFEDLGRLFTLDTLLGNSDRLPCDALGWRGNPENVMCATEGRFAGRIVAIDAAVQRRPPGGLMSSEDAACERLVELTLNDPGIAAVILKEAVEGNAAAAKVANEEYAVAAFQRGLRLGLDSALTVKGLLEMMHQCIGEWISGFIADIESSHTITPRTIPKRASSAGSSGIPTLLIPPYQSSLPMNGGGGGIGGIPGLPPPSPRVTTQKIRAINQEAQVNVGVGDRVAHWKALFRDRGQELRDAVEEWQVKRGGKAQHSMTTGFLEGTRPIVDVYELQVRLDHMLQRLRVLQRGTATARPTQLMPGVFLSGAVEANSVHLLKHLGVTHILNATEDLLPPDVDKGFSFLRLPLRDTAEEDIAPFFPEASEFIHSAVSGGGGILVHCHAGQSRSCSLVLAWLMTSRRWTLKRALDYLTTHRPQAAPNAGYMAALSRLEEELFGAKTVKVKRTKPEPKICPECGDKVGISAESLQVHLRMKHPELLRALRAERDAQENIQQATVNEKS